MLAEKLVVLDTDIPQLWNNKIFIPEEAMKVSHTILPTCFLYEQAKALGINLVTPDIFFDMKDKPIKVLMISALTTPYTQKLIAAGAKPAILTCQESPFVATRFYLNLKKYSAWFKHSMVFSGMKRHLSTKTIYHQMFLANVYNPEKFQPLAFSQKKYLTLISGNKRMGNWKKNIILKLFYGLNVREIYSLRQTIINFFAGSGKFDLYGMGWNKGGLSAADTANINNVYKGTVAEKLPVLRQYKFAFCLENAVFPGYVTEKIFDAMFAGCVPVYLGAPDVEQMLPSNTFVDMRKFKDLKALDMFLSSMTEPVYQQYVDNIQKYLNSPEFKKFSYQDFNAQIIAILQREFNA